MDTNALSELIGSIGFPAALCVAMFVQNNKMREAINNLTVAVTTLTAYVKGGKTDGGQQ